MAEVMEPEPPFGLRGQYENIWHIAAATRMSDGKLVGHRTYCGRNYPDQDERPDIAGLTEVCSDCTNQMEHRH
jgi:hypothetical protein